MRQCVDCGAKVGIKATRCKACQRDHRTAYERDRVQAKHGLRTADRPGYDQTEVDGDVIDYTTAPVRPPSFDVVRPQPMVEEGDEPVSDGRTPSPEERWDRSHKRDLTGIPALVRQDRVRLERELANRVRDEQQGELTGWDQLSAGNERTTRTADFSKPTFDRSGNSGPRTNALGQSVRRASRWP